MRRTLLQSLLLLLLVVGAPAPARAAPKMSMSVAGRVYRVPEIFFTNVFSDYRNQVNPGAALSVGLGGWSFVEPELLIAYSRLALPDGNVRLKGSAPYRTVFLRFDLHQVALAARARFDWRVWRGLHLGLSAGAGVVFAWGETVTREVLPGCVEPVSGCGHWAEVADHDLGFADQALALIIAQAHVGHELVDGWILGLEGGVENLPFIGLFVRIDAL